MASAKVQARHVFHTGTTGMDRIMAWRETTGEPAFVWGRRFGDATGPFFGSIRKLYQQWNVATDSELIQTIYHDGPSADAFGMLDPAPQKVLHMHDWFPQWERNFDWAIRCTGKVLVSHTSQVGIIRDHFGWIPERFIQVVPEPLLSGLPERQPDAGGPKQRTGIWLHGKRWRPFGNRLRAIIDRWPENGGELEILCSGSRQPGWSKKNFVIWTADLPLEFALQRLFTWDSTLLVENYSLDSPWLMRALTLDIFPLVPDGQNSAFNHAWKEESAPKPYSWGDTVAALEILKDWRADQNSLIPDFRNWRSQLLKDRLSGDSFSTNWKQILAQFADQRIPKLRKRRAYPSWYPVAWFERIQRLRAGY